MDILPSLVAIGPEGRKELHGSISPAVYSRHAQEMLIPDIAALRFPDEVFLDPLELANSSTVERGLTLDATESRKLAERQGIDGIRTRYNIFENGFGDRFFTSLAAGGIGKYINTILLSKGMIEKPLGLLDYSRMFQTGWFGDIANQMALAEPGLLQREFTRAARGEHPSGLPQFPNFEDGILLEPQLEPVSSLNIFTLSHQALKYFRTGLRNTNDRSVGCPVARTSFTASAKQAEFLEAYGHIGDSSGYYIDPNHISEQGRVKFSRGPYTVIDETLWQWGDYVQRYAESLLTCGENPEGIASTTADQVILIN